MKKYIKINNKKYQEIEEIEGQVINVDNIDNEIKELEKELKKEEPKVPELIDFAKIMHPYYQDKIYIETKIEELKKLKNSLKNIK